MDRDELHCVVSDLADQVRDRDAQIATLQAELSRAREELIKAWASEVAQLYGNSEDVRIGAADRYKREIAQDQGDEPRGKG